MLEIHFITITIITFTRQWDTTMFVMLYLVSWSRLFHAFIDYTAILLSFERSKPAVHPDFLHHIHCTPHGKYLRFPTSELIELHQWAIVSIIYSTYLTLQIRNKGKWNILSRLESFFFFVTWCPGQLACTLTIPPVPARLLPPTGTGTEQLCASRLGQMRRNHPVLFASTRIWN